MSDTRAAIIAADSAFMDAYARRDSTAVGAMYTDGGQLLPPHGDVVTGQAAIAAFWRGAMEMGIASAGLETVEIDDQGDTVIEIGRYTLVASDGETLDRGKFLVVWKNIGGGWKLHRDIWNSSESQ